MKCELLDSGAFCGLRRSASATQLHTMLTPSLVCRSIHFPQSLWKLPWQSLEPLSILPYPLTAIRPDPLAVLAIFISASRPIPRSSSKSRWAHSSKLESPPFQWQTVSLNHMMIQKPCSAQLHHLYSRNTSLSKCVLSFSKKQGYALLTSFRQVVNQWCVQEQMNGIDLEENEILRGWVVNARDAHTQIPGSCGSWLIQQKAYACCVARILRPRDDSLVLC